MNSGGWQLRLRAVGLVCAVAALAACGDAGPETSDLAGTLPDGFVRNGCDTVDDCPASKCQTVKCNVVSHMCEYKEKVCTADNECTTASCETLTGSCIQHAANEGMTCTAPSGGAGVCAGGVCNGIPSCAPASLFGSTVSCSSSSFSSVVRGNNATTASGTSIVSSYACAPTAAGPEQAFNFTHDSAAGDEDVTISLRLTDSSGQVLADQTVVDLDLIVLEDACTATAVCKNAGTAGAYAGVTTGTSMERVTFRALAGHKYFVVVDGKAADQTHDFVVEAEACGACQPTDGTRIDCNTSMPINTTTAAGAANLSDYKCGASMTPVSSPGKELPFYFRSISAVARNVTAKLVGATAAFNLLALKETFNGQCDPTKCIGFASGASGDQTLTWTIDANGGSSFTRYWVVVDSSSTQDAAFGLSLSCDPYCLSPYSLRCGSGSDTTIVSKGTTVGAPTQVDHWGPGAGCDGLTGLVGPETTVRFTPTIITPADYQVQLSGNGAVVSMTILDGGTASNLICSPTYACMANTVLPAGTYSGTRSTTATLPAGIQFQAQKDHVYYIVVDSADPAGAVFDMKIVGLGGGSGC